MIYIGHEPGANGRGVFFAQPRKQWFCVCNSNNAIVLDFIYNPEMADRLAFQATVRGKI